ncbi:hypothetical protein ACHAWF_017833 [Thalassiosira exigua]
MGKQGVQEREDAKSATLAFWKSLAKRGAGAVNSGVSSLCYARQWAYRYATTVAPRGSADARRPKAGIGDVAPLPTRKERMPSVVEGTSNGPSAPRRLPVAVAALLNELGAPPRLKVHISGESLLNDGSAVVFFFVFGGLFLEELGIHELGGESTVGQAFLIFFRMSLGGLAIGLAFAVALVFVLFHLDRRMEKEEVVLQVAATVTVAYLSFYTSEVVCKCSGVIACVACGIATRAFGSGMIADWQVMDGFWSLLEHLLNTVIFALGGIVFGDVLVLNDAEGGKVWRGRDWGYLLLLYVLVNAIRFFLMFAFYPINSRIGLGTNWQETVFASWGGLRGAVGITLALALDNLVQAEYPGNERGISEEGMLTARMFGMVGGIALLTLIINGTASGPLLMKLGLADSSKSRKRIVQCAEEATRRRILDDFLNLMTDERFFLVDFALVVAHVNLLKNLTATELQAAVEANKESVHPSLYKAPNLDRVLPYIKDSGRVRTSLVKAKESFFQSYVPGDSTRGLGGASGSLVTVTEDGQQEDFRNENIDEASLVAPADLIKDTRIMFVELLRAAYLAQIKDGELDPREYDGFLVYALFEGLNLAEDAVAKGGPLCDWTSAHFNSMTWIQKTKWYIRRATNSCGRKGGAKQRFERLTDLEPEQYQKLRMSVLLAMSFIDSHKEAQDRLQDELAKGSGDAYAAFSLVMNESKAEVRKAREVLKSQTKKKLNHVISHFLCVILLNKQARYIKQLAESGVLLPREVRHQLEEIDHEIIHIRACPLDKHPGAIDFADEIEYKGGSRGRKRVKQKSFL